MKTLTADIMATLIPRWAQAALTYTYNAAPNHCYLCSYDSLYDYDANGCTRSITSSTTVTTMFLEDGGFADTGGIIEDPASGHERNTAGFGMSLYGTAVQNNFI